MRERRKTARFITRDGSFGAAEVDVLVCDHCGIEEAEDLAVGWAIVSDAGVSARTMADLPEIVVCSWPCLRAVDVRFPLNAEPRRPKVVQAPSAGESPYLHARGSSPKWHRLTRRVTDTERERARRLPLGVSIAWDDEDVAGDIYIVEDPDEPGYVFVWVDTTADE